MSTDLNNGLSALCLAIGKHLVLIRNTAKGVTWGTGVSMKFGDHEFVITAAHVIEGAQDEEIYLNFGIDRQEHVIKKKRMWIDRGLDIGLIEIDPFEALIFKGEFSRPFSPNAQYRNQTLEHSKTGCVVMGFPTALMKPLEDGSAIYTPVQSFNTRIVSSDAWPSGITAALKEKGHAASSHFLLQFGSLKSLNLKNREGEYVDSPDPHGWSGAGVWLYEIDSLNTDSPKYGPFGILTGLYRREELLVGVSIKAIADKLKADYSIELPDGPENRGIGI